MCRSIVTLRRPDVPASEDEVRAAARQFVRKVSGYRIPSRRNQDAFEQAIDEIAVATRRLLDGVDSHGHLAEDVAAHMSRVAARRTPSDRRASAGQRPRSRP